LRVASELGLDSDPEFQSHSLRIGHLANQLGIAAKRLGIAHLAERLGIADLAQRLGIADLAQKLGFGGFGGADADSEQTASPTEERSEKLDRAADALIKKLDIWQDSYILFVSATSRDPVKAQRLASSVANEYLASQREARQEALEHVAVWLKGRLDNLQSRVSETESLIEKLKVKTGVRDDDLNNDKEQQIGRLNTDLMAARDEAEDKRARLEQARQVLEADGDPSDIPGVQPTLQDPAGLRPVFSELLHRRMEINFSLVGLKNKFGEQNPQVVSARAALTAVNKQIYAEREHILANMQNDYDISARRAQSLKADLQALTANLHSEASIKLRQLQRAADSDRKDYESYLAQYNNISEQREMQSASARIISPATLPRSPSSNRLKFYALGGVVGLGGGLMLAFLLEYFKTGVKSSTEIEQSFGLPVVGFVPLVSQRRTRRASYHQSLDTVVNQPLSHLSEAVRSMRVSLEVSNASSKVILITSALPGEGKSTAAMLLAASSAGSGKRTILLDCDFRLRSTSEALRSRHRPGLFEVLCGTANLTDVITQDPVTKINLIPAGSTRANAADLLMSQGMLDLIAVLRNAFDYVIIDSPPLLPVVDALALATGADKILVVVEWRRTPRATIHEAFKVLGPQAHRVAGVVLNKVDFDELPGYGRYQYRRYYSNARS